MYTWPGTNLHRNRTLGIPTLVTTPTKESPTATCRTFFKLGAGVRTININTREMCAQLLLSAVCTIYNAPKKCYTMADLKDCTTKGTCQIKYQVLKTKELYKCLNINTINREKERKRKTERTIQENLSFYDCPTVRICLME